MTCATTPAVTFDYAAWVIRYPELNAVGEPYAQLCFNEATLYCANTLCIVCDATQLSALLNMLTAHIVKLYAPQVNGQPSTAAGAGPGPGTVGRVDNATQGSVSVHLDLPTLPAAAAWFQQTQYGLSFWQACAQYRTARYVRGPAMRPAFSGPYGGFYPIGGAGPWGTGW